MESPYKGISTKHGTKGKNTVSPRNQTVSPRNPNLYHHNPAEEQVEAEYLEDIQKDIIRYIDTSVPDRPNWAIRQRELPGKHGSSRREKKTVKVSLFWEKQVVK